MKKLILPLFAALTLITTANAQKIRYGLKLGESITNFGGKLPENTTGKLSYGINAGAFAEIMLTDKFGIQPEILFSSEGAKFEYTNKTTVTKLPTFGLTPISTSGKIDKVVKYINVPVMCKYYITDKFNVELGPQVGFLIYSKNIINDAGGAIIGFPYPIPATGEQKIDMKDNTQKVDFSGNLGLTYEFTKNLFVNARYSYGFTEIYKNDPADAKNRVATLFVGYKF